MGVWGDGASSGVMGQEGVWKLDGNWATGKGSKENPSQKEGNEEPGALGEGGLF